MNIKEYEKILEIKKEVKEIGERKGYKYFSTFPFVNIGIDMAPLMVPLTAPPIPSIEYIDWHMRPNGTYSCRVEIEDGLPPEFITFVKELLERHFNYKIT